MSHELSIACILEVADVYFGKRAMHLFFTFNCCMDKNHKIIFISDAHGFSFLV